MFRKLVKETLTTEFWYKYRTILRMAGCHAP